MKTQSSDGRSKTPMDLGKPRIDSSQAIESALGEDWVQEIGEQALEVIWL